MEKETEKINIIFKHLGNFFSVKAIPGTTVLEAAHRDNIPLEGACEGNLKCSTCHVICDNNIFDLASVADRENDLLDLTYGVKPTSRLTCQIKVDKSIENAIFEIPKCTKNLAVDGHKPMTH
jgi:ferredoxin